MIGGETPRKSRNAANLMKLGVKSKEKRRLAIIEGIKTNQSIATDRFNVSHGEIDRQHGSAIKMITNHANEKLMLVTSPVYSFHKVSTMT